MPNLNPLVSIVCPTYNQEKFIAQTLEGFIMQKTTFPIEIIVHDDASKDNTAAIVREYEAKHPHLFANIYQAENQFSKAIDYITRLTYAVARGKYIALCEGDDYWTDSYKLQKQIDFLEANPDYVISFHRVYELENNKGLVLSNINKSDKEETYTIKDLAQGNLIHTPSVVFRKGLIKEFPDWFSQSPVCDYVLHMLNAKHGFIKYFPEPMAVYRVNSGIWSSQNRQTILLKWNTVLELLLTEDFEDAIIEELRAQKTKYLNEYLHILFNDDRKLFLKQLEFFADKDPALLKDWLLVQYPKLLDRAQQTIEGTQHTIENIKLSKAYKFAQNLAALKPKFF